MWSLLANLRNDLCFISDAVLGTIEVVEHVFTVITDVFILEQKIFLCCGSLKSICLTR